MVAFVSVSDGMRAFRALHNTKVDGERLSVTATEDAGQKKSTFGNTEKHLRQGQRIQAALERCQSGAPRCRGCRMLPRDCICDTVVEHHNLRHRVAIYQHFKELRRTSNSAALIPCALPDNGQIFIAGNPPDEYQFQELLQRDPANTYVMFPSDDAITVR